MDRGAWQATVHEVAKSQTQLSDEAQHNSASKACVGDTVGWFQSTMIKQIQQESKSREFFGFPVHTKVIYTTVCEVCNSIMSKKKRETALIKNYFIAKILAIFQ